MMSSDGLTDPKQFKFGSKVRDDLFIIVLHIIFKHTCKYFYCISNFQPPLQFLLISQSRVVRSSWYLRPFCCVEECSSSRKQQRRKRVARLCFPFQFPIIRTNKGHLAWIEAKNSIFSRILSNKCGKKN